MRRYEDREIRVSVSWKAEVFANEAAARIRTEHTDDLSIEGVVTALLDDLERKGSGVPRPEDPTRDEFFIRALNETYPLPMPGG